METSEPKFVQFSLEPPMRKSKNSYGYTFCEEYTDLYASSEGGFEVGLSYDTGSTGGTALPSHRETESPVDIVVAAGGPVVEEALDIIFALALFSCPKRP